MIIGFGDTLELAGQVVSFSKMQKNKGLKPAVQKTFSGAYPGGGAFRRKSMFIQQRKVGTAGLGEILGVVADNPAMLGLAEGTRGLWQPR